MKISNISASKNAFAVTPSDTETLTQRTEKGWSVNADGNVKACFHGMTDDAQAVTIYAIAGVRYPDVLTKVFSTGTTATGIVGYWG
jgi:hypothetical protein